MSKKLNQNLVIYAKFLEPLTLKKIEMLTRAFPPNLQRIYNECMNKKPPIFFILKTAEISYKFFKQHFKLVFYGNKFTGKGQ